MHYPNLRIILKSYEADFAASWGRKIMDLINEYGHILDTALADNLRSSKRFLTKTGGELATAGAGGAITGKGADLLIIDDPIKNYEEAMSKTYREKTWDWFNTTAYTRLEPNGSVILVQTRWHFDDLAGRILANDVNNEWDVVNFPAINEFDEALFPERYPLEKLQEIKQQLGSYAFSALYQQTPLASDNIIFNPNWWQFTESIPTNFDKIVQSWDTAFKDKQENDYTACVTAGIKDNKVYIIDRLRIKAEFPALERLVISMAERYNADGIIIEDKASGQSLIQTLKKNTSLRIIPYKPDGDKVTRAWVSTPEIEAGNVILPSESAWTNEFITEMMEFPYGRYKDTIDAFTQLMIYLKQFNTKFVYAVAKHKRAI
jgi:predicted phage terminase large subunit-like protein